jgi:hypothetical protein
MRDKGSQRRAATLIFYLVLSLLFFGRGLVGSFSTCHIGVGADPPLMMWYLAWWPHALASGTNPFLTHAYWAPDGFNLMWSTSIPLISLLAAPITTLFGPVVSLNTFCLLGLPLVAWSAFLLCEYLSENYWSSILGGYVFGFSPVLLGQLYFGRLHSLWVFPIPLVVYLSVRRFRGELSARCFVPLLVLLLVVQFLSSTEIFAISTLFGAMAFVIGWLTGPTDTRLRLRQFAFNLICAYAVVFLIISPLLYIMFLYPRPFSGPIWDERMLSADILNFLIPTPLNALGGIPWFDSISAPFNRGLPPEQVAYLSWPLIAIAFLFAFKFWRQPLGRLLVDSLLIILVCSLGQELMVWAHPTKIVLPWVLFRWSILANAAPGRFCMYAFLVLALMVSLWLPAARMGRWAKIATGLVVFAALTPNLSATYWISPANTPRFFSSNLYRKYIARGETVFIFPAWPQSDSMTWQAQTGMYFNLGDGPGAWPEPMVKWPVVESFTRRIYLPDAAKQFRGYLVNHGVTTVVVDQASLPLWRGLLSALGHPLRIDDVYLYKLMPADAEHTALSFIELRRQFDDQRFETLLTRVAKYLADGGNPDALTSRNLLKLGLLSLEDIAGLPTIPGLRHPEREVALNPRYRFGVVLFPTENNLLAIGESAWYPDARRLTARYRDVTTETAFVSLHGSAVVGGDSVGVMVMSFSRDQLAKAAAIANASLSQEREPRTANE